MPTKRGTYVTREAGSAATQINIRTSVYHDHVIVELERKSDQVRAMLTLGELDELLLIMAYYRKELADALEKDEAG